MAARARTIRPQARLLALGVVAAAALSLSVARAEATLDDARATPRGATAAFLEAAERGDSEAVAAALGVPATASASRKAEALELGRELALALSKSAAFDIDNVSDDPNGTARDGPNAERVATLRGDERELLVLLERSKRAPFVWTFSPGTQARIPELYARYRPSPLEARVPTRLKAELLGLPYWQWLGLVAAFVAALLCGGMMAYALDRVARRVAVRTRVLWDDELVAGLRAPMRLLIRVIVYLLLAQALSLPGPLRLVSFHIAGTLGLIALTWATIRVVAVISNVVERQAVQNATAEESRGGLTARTQVRVLRRVVNVVLCGCAGAIGLLQFDVVRSVGVSLLASAGIAGVVLGLAAQRTLGSIFAGIQLSLSQPIRIGDDVVIEGEFGAIEEITLTYVVVRLWDERRLIVPMTRFLEQPFQNWTKVSPRLLGTVLIHADFTLPVDALRAEVDRLLAGNPRWDERTKVVQVTDVQERTLEVRVLVSAADGSKLFELRCELREKLATWLTRFEAGRYLPTHRVQSGSEPAPDPGSHN